VPLSATTVPPQSLNETPSIRSVGAHTSNHGVQEINQKMIELAGLGIIDQRSTISSQ
jgi:hypothetical protein